MEKVIKTPIPTELFKKKLTLLSIPIPVNSLGPLVKENKAVKSILLKRYGIKPVIEYNPSPPPAKEEIIKKRVIFSEEFKKVEDLPKEVQTSLAEYLKDAEPHTIELSYEHFGANEVLKELLPKDAVVPSGYEIVGSILHFNLSEQLLPYKGIIGQVFLDKTKGIKTVVTKVDHIESVYRYYKMEVMAGESSFVTRQKEYSCIFELDLSKVYWCSRLSTERKRMLNIIPKGCVLCDMFCGVGPLSVQAAKDRNCKVLANDLNPDCFVYLKKNAALNKVEGKLLPFNMDAREFVRMIVRSSNKSEGPQTIPKEFLHFDQVYMNLPVDAVEFLDVFCGLFINASKEVWNESNLPLIHVYAFTEQEDTGEAKVALCERINKIFGKYKPLAISDIINCHQIRDVSAKSKMYALTFKLSKEVGFGVISAPTKAAEKEVEIPKKHPMPEAKEPDPVKKPKLE